MKNALVVLALLIVGQVSAQQALGEVTGTIVEYGSTRPAVDAKIVINDGTRIYQARVDLDGEFRISAIPAGKYLLKIVYQADTMSNIPVDVPMDGIARLGVVQFESKITEVEGAVVIGTSNDMKLIDGNLPVTKITAEEIGQSAVRTNIKDLITSVSSNVQQAADGQLVFRGARKGDMIYMIDGVKTSDAGTIPSVSIGYMMVYTGGLPAKYGDTLGGVVVIESKSYFDLYRAWEADQIRQGLR